MNMRLIGGVLSVGLACFSLGFISGYNVGKNPTIMDHNAESVYLSSVKMVPGICVQPTWFVERWEKPNPILRLMEEGEKQWRTERWFDDHWDTTILSVYKRSADEYRVVTCPVKQAQGQIQHQEQNAINVKTKPMVNVVLPALPLSGIVKKEIRGQEIRSTVNKVEYGVLCPPGTFPNSDGKTCQSGINP